MKNNHTFAICAYKESQYLGDCIESILEQQIKSEVYISTSTPNTYIYDTAKKYGLDVYETGSESGIQKDWNHAYNIASTELVTIAHQDDVYSSDYAYEVTENYKREKDALIFFSDYIPIINGEEGQVGKNKKIKKLLKTPLRSRFFSRTQFWKKAVLSFGNPICCPSVSYNKRILGNNIFRSKLDFALDWDTFLEIAKLNGAFVYINKPLIKYRIHEESTTKKIMKENQRIKEDAMMFDKIWPHFITNIIMKFYKRAYDAYGDK